MKRYTWYFKVKKYSNDVIEFTVVANTLTNAIERAKIVNNKIRGYNTDLEILEITREKEVWV